MKVLSKIFLLLGLAVAMMSTPLIADEKKGTDDVVKAATEVSLTEDAKADEEFYFPAFNAAMEAFWLGMEPMHNSCDATSFLGGTASATCLNRQSCVCTANFFYAECHCKTHQSLNN